MRKKYVLALDNGLVKWVGKEDGLDKGQDFIEINSDEFVKLDEALKTISSFCTNRDLGLDIKIVICN